MQGILAYFVTPQIGCVILQGLLKMSSRIQCYCTDRRNSTLF